MARIFNMGALHLLVQLDEIHVKHKLLRMLHVVYLGWENVTSIEPLYFSNTPNTSLWLRALPYSEVVDTFSG